MKKLLLALLLISACIAAVPLRFLLLPAQEVAVPLPIGSAIARVQVWAFSAHAIVVETPYGRAHKVMWEDWGPAHRTNLYVTPEGWLAALGGAGSSAIFDIGSNAPPVEVTHLQARQTNSDDWTYLGAVDREEKSGRYVFSADRTECFAMFGEGDSPYRKAYQAKHFCSRH